MHHIYLLGAVHTKAILDKRYTIRDTHGQIREIQSEAIKKVHSNAITQYESDISLEVPLAGPISD